MAADRISALPEPILHHILSFLPMEEIVRTAVLSKTWKQVWHTFPILKLNGGYNSFTKNKRILRFMERTLRNRSMEMINLRKFALWIKLSDHAHFVSLIDRCPCYAIDCNMKRMRLSFVCGWYNLPQRIFGAKSLDVLELSGCKLQKHRVYVTLSSLRKLTLSYVYANGDVFENLVAGCPLIEYLDISFCEWLKSLELPSLSKLKEIGVTNNSQLRKLKIEGLNVHDITIFAPATSCEINVAPCKNLRVLKLGQICITDEWLCNEISQFPLLEVLSIAECNKLENINISSPYLKTLCINECSKVIEVKIDTPNLNMLSYGGDLISFSSNPLALSEADMHFDSKDIDTQWFVRYIELLSKFHQLSNVVNLHSNTGKNVIVPGELRQMLCPPLLGVKHLTFEIHGYMDFPISDIVDGLMWILPHAETISVEYENAYWDMSSIQISYKKKLTDGQIPHCCKSIPVSCWQHCVKEVSIKHARLRRGRILAAERHCVEGEEILQKIDGVCSNLMDEYKGDVDGDMSDGTQNSDESD